MSEDAEGSLPEKQDETEAINITNLDNIFDDDNEHVDVDDDLLDGTADLETTFDDVSPPVSKKIKTHPDEPSLVPSSREANDPIQETVHSSTSDWHNAVTDSPHRHEIIRAM
jgi:hypothetical protein